MSKYEVWRQATGFDSEPVLKDTFPTQEKAEEKLCRWAEHADLLYDDYIIVKVPDDTPERYRRDEQSPPTDGEVVWGEIE